MPCPLSLKLLHFFSSSNPIVWVQSMNAPSSSPSPLHQTSIFGMKNLTWRSIEITTFGIHISPILGTAFLLCKFELFFQASKEVKWYLPWNYIMVTHIHSTSPNFSHIWTQVNKPLWIMLIVKFLGSACERSKPYNLNTWLGIW